MTGKKVLMTALSTLALAMGSAGDARANLVVNGDFESYTPGQFANIDPRYAFGDLQYSPVTGWTSPPLNSAGTTTGNMLYIAGSGDTTGSNYYNNGLGGPGYGDFVLAGPNSGSNNGLPASSPTGGNFLGLDADPNYNGAVSQTISGLIAGRSYQLSFYWAGAQLAGYGGATHDLLQVSFGSQPQSPAEVQTAQQGFTGWMPQTMPFTADGPSDTLSSLAIGGPSGLPPFVLLDGVSLTAVPE